MGRGLIVDPTDRRLPYKKPPESKEPTLFSSEEYSATWDDTTGASLFLTGVDKRADGWEISDLVLPSTAFKTGGRRLRVGHVLSGYSHGGTTLKLPYTVPDCITTGASFTIKRYLYQPLLAAYWGTQSSTGVILDAAFGDLSALLWSEMELVLGYLSNIDSSVRFPPVHAVSASFSGGTTRVVFNEVIDDRSAGQAVALISRKRGEQFNIEEPSRWLCDICGYPYRKWELTRREFTNKLVCENDMDKLSHDELKTENRQGEALARAAERLSVLSEIP